MADEEAPSLLEFPCDFPLKIIGVQQPGYAQAILGVVQRHAPDYDGSTMEMRPSAKGKYLSLTCTIRATSRAQLDALYRALCDHPMVVKVL
jgi:putative lipoic acid-binding regulatory protein